MKEVIICVTIYLSILGIGAYGLTKAACNRLQATTGINTRYDLLNGCYVEVNGRFIPQENWRGEYQQ